MGGCDDSKSGTRRGSTGLFSASKEFGGRHAECCEMRQIIAAVLLLISIVVMVTTIGRTYSDSGNRVQNFTQSTISADQNLAQR
jgi:hypothetical protein